MKNYIFGLGFVLVALVPLATFGGGRRDNSLVQFKGGIGDIPVSNVTASSATPPVITVNSNIVRLVPPAGQIWVISGLDADVSIDGHIRVHGRGLLLGGGNGIGTNGGASVFATLFCGPASSAVASSSGLSGVALDANGDFTIDDVLSPVPSDTCATPVLLIRDAAGTTNPWFAAGFED